MFLASVTHLCGSLDVDELDFFAKTCQSLLIIVPQTQLRVYLKPLTTRLDCNTG